MILMIEVRDVAEIDVLINKVIDLPGPRFPNMTYEDGIRAALEWVIKENDDDILE